MISQRKALNTLIHARKKDLLRLQERILRCERFGGNAISSEVVATFEHETKEQLLARHQEIVAEIRELEAVAQAAADHDVKLFVDEIKRQRREGP